LNNIVSDAIKGLLGSLGKMRLYTQEETNELAAETKRLQEAVNPTVENLRLQSVSIRAKADIVVAQLQNVSESAKAQTDVVIAAAETIEVLEKETQKRSAAMDRIYRIASESLPAIEALLAGDSDSDSDPEPQQRLPETRSGFQLPYRK
jgi:methyl-accepting chemotaxis protein